MKILVILFCTAAAGCAGPTVYPAVQRLEPDEQALVDHMWNNMLNPVDRLDRELLLDVMLAYELHVYGIDRLKLDCEKDFDGGTIRIKLDYDRRRAREDDRLVVEIRDNKGNLLRREVYQNEEVLSHFKQITGVVTQEIYLLPRTAIAASAATQPTTQTSANPSAGSPTIQPKQSEDEKAAEQWRDARWHQIRAATQPSEPEKNPN